MKDKNEIEFISKLLSNSNIRHCGPVEYKQSYSLHVTNKRNLMKLSQFDIFKLHPERENKLEGMLQTYEREQTDSYKKEQRFCQIKQVLKSHKVTAMEVSKEIDMSLNQAQVLLKEGFDKDLWKRERLGHKAPYVYLI